MVLFTFLFLLLCFFVYAAREIFPEYFNHESSSRSTKVLAPPPAPPKPVITNETVVRAFLETWRTKGGKATFELLDSRTEPSNLVWHIFIENDAFLLKSYERPVSSGAGTYTMINTGDQIKSEEFAVNTVVRMGKDSTMFLPQSMVIGISRDRKKVCAVQFAGL